MDGAIEMSADANADRRFSTETQRANGFRQSVLPGRAERIAEDIKNGNYSCAICLDRIEHIHEALWSCDQCHSVWHHRCIKPWSDRGRSSFFVGSWTWKCPTCAKRHHAIEGASCWCGKERAMERDPMADYPLNPATLQVHSGALSFSDRQTRAGAIPVGSSAPNSCGKVCGRGGQCSHRAACKKICHPGPCSQACNECPVGSSVPLTSWQKACDRLKQRSTGSMSALLISSAIVLALYAGFTTFIVFHTRWYTMPYVYPGWLEARSADLTIGIVIGGMLLVLPITFIIGGFFLASLYYILELFLGIAQSLETGPSYPSRIGLRYLLGCAFGIMALLGLAYPIIGLTAVPDTVWYHQMKDSCEGYSTRIRMEDYQPATRYTPARIETYSKFNFKSLSSGHTTNYYLGHHLEPKFGTDKSYQFHHRLSGALQNGTFIAVDVDTENNIWRVQQLSHDDRANQWDSYERTLARPDNATTLFLPLPTLVEIEERTMLNGTIGSFSKAHPHMFLPELDLVVQNMHGYIHGYDLDAFMRVFNTDVIADRGINPKILDETWNWNGRGKKDKLYPVIDMRTASFGHGSQAVTFCAKERLESSSQSRFFDGGHELDLFGDMRIAGKEGVKEDLLIPFTILASFRERAIQNQLRR